MKLISLYLNILMKLKYIEDIGFKNDVICILFEDHFGTRFRNFK